MFPKLFLILLLPVANRHLYQPTKVIRKPEWLCGNWQNKTDNGIIYESWKKTDINQLFGKSYVIRDKDTIVFETMTIVEEGDSLFYIPRVVNQNEGLPVRFSLKTCTSTKVMFENPRHDFPQLISLHQDKSRFSGC